MTDRKEPNRRSALAGIGAAGASLFVACKQKWEPPTNDPFSRARTKPHVPGAELWATHEERFANTTCGQCPAGCGLRIRVVEGRAVRVEGNPSNPLNGRGVGVRGLSSLQALYDPDRLTSARMRKQKGGELDDVSWEAALSRVSGELAKVTGDDLLVVSGRERGLMNELLERFTAAAGGRFADAWPTRSGPIREAMTRAVGHREIPAYDWAGAKMVLSLEAGLMEDSCQAVYFARMAAKRRGRDRARLVHAGPAFDLSAHNADTWLRLEPGTSGALALALCHVLLADDTYDRAALERSTARADFEALVRAHPPARVAEITGVDEAAIRALARSLWSSQPSFALIDERSVSFSNGAETAHAVIALNALLGAIEAPVGGLRLVAEAPLRPWPAALAGEPTRLRRSVDVLSALESATPPRVVLLYYTNPAFARAEPDRWRAALARASCVVSFSPYLDETVADVADVVLPDHTFLERYEDAGAAPGLPRAVVGVRQPVIASLHDTRATGDVVIDLAHRRGGELAAALPWRSFREALDARLLGLHDAGRGSPRAASERGFLEALYDEGVWVEAAAAEPRPVSVGLAVSWKPPAWSGDAGKRPLRMLIYRPLGNAVGGGANQPWLHQLRGRPGDRPWLRQARVHPSSATGLTSGDEITITSDTGSITMPVLFDERLQAGVIAVPLGGGHSAFGRFAGGGANPMRLVGAEQSDLLCGTRVSIGAHRG